MTFTRLTDGQLDALKEISNIGMGHAATALSQLIGETVRLRVPQVSVTDIAQVPELLGGSERVVVGITLQVLGDARGNILLILPEKSACQLLARLLGREETDLELNEISGSTLKEVGNILASAYLNALGSLLHMTLIPSIPLLAHDMAGAVVDHVLIELSMAGDLALMVDTEFQGDSPTQATIKGHFFLLPDPQSLNLVLKAAGGEE
ncbi:chemotaxis protein CheC [Desulfuromonas sp. TF]|jgi:chemotaxis protein CheC|uniref:chemotaxis protein CheC n=1 Tax=Desulfuromonas sp. TF TaxID=1232410 RepID=UPI00042194F4|nr:chemotaxis protein CheC [Desulfuromonas sp. TF]